MVEQEIVEEINETKILENKVQEELNNIDFSNVGTHTPYYYTYGPNVSGGQNPNSGIRKKVSRNVSNSQRRKFR